MVTDYNLRYLIKICGNKYPRDSHLVASFEPDFMGWIFSPLSSRQIILSDIREQINYIKQKHVRIKHVAVFAGNSIEEIADVSFSCYFDYLQIIETAFFIKKLNEKLLQKKDTKVTEGIILPKILPTLRVREELKEGSLKNYSNKHFFIFDSFVSGQAGGTGKSFNLEYIKFIQEPYLLAGGINADNVAESLLNCNAFGVDLSSGVEKDKNRPGYKDEVKLNAFIKRVRGLRPHNRVVAMPS